MRNLFLFIVWSKARKFEDEIRADLARHFTIVRECEIAWPRWDFTRRLWNFYGFGTRFTWWNKGRKCGRGPFRVFVVDDAHGIWAHRRDTRGQDLLVDRNVYDEKRALRKMTRHANIIHSSVTQEETREQLAFLGLGHLLDGAAVPSAAEIEEILDRGAGDCLGSGSRRECRAIPGTDLCVKFYRDEGALAGAVAREIHAARHDERRNTCCQEARYYGDLRRTLPRELFAAFPARLEQIHLPTRGWALVESRIRNGDGSECLRFSLTYRSSDEATKRRLLDEFRRLIRGFAAHGVRFYDTQNVIVQKTTDGFRLRVVDFEPASRTLLPIDRWFPFLVRLKVLRRAARYCREHIGVDFDIIRT